MTSPSSSSCPSASASPYGCHNHAPFAAGMLVQDGWNDLARTSPRMVLVPFRLRDACSYTFTALGQADQRCLGCKHREKLC